MKARDAKKLLRQIQVLSLQPGDVLVVTIPPDSPQAAIEHLYRDLEVHFPRTPVAVVVGDIGLRVVRGAGTVTTEMQRCGECGAKRPVADLVVLDGVGVCRDRCPRDEEVPT